MDRREFIANGVAAGIAIALSTQTTVAKRGDSNRFQAF